MTNGSDLIEFEEQHMEELVRVFIEEKEEEWAEFVLEQYNEYNAGLV